MMYSHDDCGRLAPPASADRRSTFWCAGISLIEVIIALGIMGLLTAILVPAVQQARQTSRRVQCSNNLRQIGTALANAEQELGAFPTREAALGIHRRLLPYLGYGALHEWFVRLQSSENPAKEFDVEKEFPGTVPPYVCPSDDQLVVKIGEMSYQVNFGSRFPGVEANGFSDGDPQKDIRASEFTDGLSNTAAFAERLVVSWSVISIYPPEFYTDTKRYLWFTEKEYSKRGEEDLAIDQCRHHRTTSWPQSVVMGGNALDTYGGYNHLLPPNHPACFNGPEDDDIEPDVFLLPPSSYHPGGANVLFGDGSMHFVSENVDAEVWRAAGSRNGAENLGLPF